MTEDATKLWTSADASDLYEVTRWGKGFFSASEKGHLYVHPERESFRSIDIKELIDRLRLRGLQLPILLHFNDILKDRLREIHDVFSHAIADHDYRGTYTCVYPVKVNQQRQVVEQIVKHGRNYGFGLEAGSKPELLAGVAMTDADMPIICNGFKDADFVEMAMLAQKIGRQVIPVVEKFTELDLILRVAKRVGVRPAIGMRVKLATRGSGRWKRSGGYGSKFGLSTTELLKGLRQLEQAEMSDCLKLLHFHLGSQITNIRYIKAALNEAARIYAELVRRGSGLEYLDVGGGLGVDYDGSQTNFESSVNYSLEEYANDVVHYIQTVCDDAGVPHPNIISESGRAVAAYHSVLVFEVLGVSSQGPRNPMPEQWPDSVEQPLHDLLLTYQELSLKNLIESYHDAQLALEMANSLFSTGYLPLEQRSLAEHLFFKICRRIHKLVEELDEVPEELEGLNQSLSDMYFCNFSLFQSMPDSWAVNQLFPVMPLHRLNEFPNRFGVLGDMTCDSDGTIDRFLDHRGVRPTLPLHTFDGSPYYLGAFLVGAYQEILGDLHNLFGDTNAVHVNLTESGQVVLETIIKGDTVREVLEYVQFKDRDLIHRLQTAVETAVGKGSIDHEEAGRFVRFYEDSLNSYTYLETPHENVVDPASCEIELEGPVAR